MKTREWKKVITETLILLLNKSRNVYINIRQSRLQGIGKYRTAKQPALEFAPRAQTQGAWGAGY